MKKYGSNKERAEALGVIMSMINDGRSKNLLQNFVQNAAKLPPMPVV
jgi:hypothetical protein